MISQSHRQLKRLLAALTVTSLLATLLLSTYPIVPGWSPRERHHALRPDGQQVQARSELGPIFNKAKDQPSPPESLEVVPRWPVSNDPLYKKCKAKGRTFISWLCNPKLVPPENQTSFFFDFTHMAMWGWNLSRSELDRIDGEHSPPLIRTLDGAIEEGLRLRWEHSIQSTVNGITYSPTSGFYDMTLFRKSALLDTTQSASPLRMAEGFAETTLVNGVPDGPMVWNMATQKVIELSRWSDVAFISWKYLCDARADDNRAPEVVRTTRKCLKGLKWVMQQHISNQDTLNVMKIALRSIVGKGTGRAKGWPGKKIKKGDQGFAALLGTPNVSGTVYMLIQHANELGSKEIKSITVYNDRYPNDVTPYRPTLLIELGDVDV